MAWRGRFLIVPLYCGVMMLAGCNTPSLHAPAPPSAAKPYGGNSSTTDDAGWPGSSSSGDADRKAQYHEVRPGETLSDLAKMYGVSVARLVTANSLDTADGLKPGHILKIPHAP